MVSPRIYSGMFRGGVPGKGKTVVDNPPVDKTKEPMDIKASVFFDGTYNNRVNVSLAQANPTRSVVVHGTDRVFVSDDGGTGSWVDAPHLVNLKGGSYDRYYSNVAILEYMNDIQNEETEVSVYVEGIGTLDYGGENAVGGVTGAGATGVPAKVTRGITLLAENVQRKLKAANKRLGHLKVNVYGFSRGAAAARHFVARRTPDFFPKELNLTGTLKVAPSLVSINFVGLYDTVSSYVSMQSDLLKFFDNTQELHLNIGGHAQRVVQLAAGDEFRSKFSLTNINSSINAGVGYQCVIPGDHSDVGGGHKEGEVETEGSITAEQRTELLAQGWFTPAQLPPTPPPLPAFFYPTYGFMPMTQPPPVTQAKRTVHAGYQFIPLALMMALAKKQGATFKDFTSKFAAYKVPPALQELNGLMRASVVDKHETHFALPANLAHQVRNRYLHRSTDNSFPAWIASGGRTVNGHPERKVISDAS